MRSLALVLALARLSDAAAPPAAFRPPSRPAQTRPRRGVTARCDGRGEADDAAPYLLDERGRPRGLRPGTAWDALRTPHAGRKFQPTHPQGAATGLRWPWRRQRTARRRPSARSAAQGGGLFARRRCRRFTEGWYYRLTLPDRGESFVFVFSIEDAGRYVGGRKSPLTLACMQLLGPGDAYLVQSDADDTKFWGWEDGPPALGCTFAYTREFADSRADAGEDARDVAALVPAEWREAVDSGFQCLPFRFQGRLDGHDGTRGGVRAGQGTPGTAAYDFAVRPVAGWGDHPCPPDGPAPAPPRDGAARRYRQRSTAGWLASFPVFEPHWQITMAHARASGTLNWNGTVYDFEDAPFYGEKNWGGAFPTKWYWTQCNSFVDHPNLSFTAGGGIRELPLSFLPGKRTETLGLIGIHHEGRFFEIVPWTGEVEWSVRPWGRWEFRGRCVEGEDQFEAEIVATTEEEGVLLRAPTKEEGMQYFCRDSGYGRVVLSLYALEWDEGRGDFRRAATLVDAATSTQCAVEVGGGPWWDTWTAKSKMSNTMKRLIRLPYKLRRLAIRAR